MTTLIESDGTIERFAGVTLRIPRTQAELLERCSIAVEEALGELEFAQECFHLDDYPCLENELAIEAVGDAIDLLRQLVGDAAS
jgi:hypothetical protein